MDVKDSILIGEMLIDEELITPEQLDVGLKEQKKRANSSARPLWI